MDFQNVTVTVPVSRVSDLLAFAAGLARSDVTRQDGEEGGSGARAMSASAIRMAYLGGKSAHWRPFIDVLVDNSDQWVEWLQLCDKIGLRPPQAAGMLGAAERRCGTSLPYEKRQVGGIIYFRMSTEVASVIRETGVVGEG